MVRTARESIKFVDSNFPMLRNPRSISQINESLVALIQYSIQFYTLQLIKSSRNKECRVRLMHGSDPFRINEEHHKEYIKSMMALGYSVNIDMLEVHAKNPSEHDMSSWLEQFVFISASI